MNYNTSYTKDRYQRLQVKIKPVAKDEIKYIAKSLNSTVTTLILNELNLMFQEDRKLFRNNQTIKVSS